MSTRAVGQWFKAKGCRARHGTHFHAGCRSPRVQRFGPFAPLSSTCFCRDSEPCPVLPTVLHSHPCGPCKQPWSSGALCSLDPPPPAPFLVTSLLPRRLGHLQAGALAGALTPTPQPVVQASRGHPRRNTRAPLVTSECPALFLGWVQCPLSLWETHPLWEARPSSCPVHGQCCQALCSTRASL